MTAIPKIDVIRRMALDLAVTLDAPWYATAAEVIATADVFVGWLTGKPVRLVLHRPVLTFQQGPAPGPGIPTKHHNHGGIMSVQLSDTQQVSYAVEAEDSKGVQVSDTLTWSEDSGGTVIALTVSDDGMSAEAVAGSPGTATISVTDGTLSASDLITVTAGPVASLVLTPGTPEDVPAP